MFRAICGVEMAAAESAKVKTAQTFAKNIAMYREGVEKKRG